MKNLLLVSFLLVGILTWSQTPIGVWKTIDDETGKAKSHVKIYKKSNGKLYGKVVKILNKSKLDAKCTKCTGKKKNQPIKNMEILWGLKKDDDEWNGGKILDPNSGKVYKALIKMENKDKLKVRGYIGFSLIGRSQYWYRVK